MNNRRTVFSQLYDNFRQKFVLLYGEGANSKSVVLAVLTQLLGPDNISHVPLKMFGERFQLTTAIGKLANIAAEIGELSNASTGFQTLHIRLP
jgi:phage/plasmid-associated DNA primase